MIFESRVTLFPIEIALQFNYMVKTVGWIWLSLGEKIPKLLNFHFYIALTFLPKVVKFIQLSSPYN